MNYKKISKKSILEWCLVRTLFFIIVLISSIALTLVLVSNYAYMVDNISKTGATLISIVAYIYLVVMLVLTVTYAYVFPYIQYKNYQYKITDDTIEVNRGVIFKRKEYVPFVRLQHIEIYRGITDRIFGMSTITIFTGGSKIVLKNIEKNEAEQELSHLRGLMKGLKANYDKE